MKQLINEAAATTTKTDVIEATAETVEQDNITVDMPPVRNNENEEIGHLKVGIFPEGKKTTSKGMSFEEVYEKLGINDDTPMTPELSMQVQKMHFGFETDEEVLAYHARIQERIEKTFNELEKAFHEQMLEKGIDPQSLTLKDFSDWLKSHKSDKQKAEDALIDLTTGDLELLDMIPAKSLMMPKHKVMNAITKANVTPDEDETAVTVLINDGKGNSYLEMTLDFDNNVEIKDNDRMRFTPYDREVFNGICSRLESGNNTFTAAQIYRIINGIEDTMTPSKESIARIDESIEKMIKIRVKIDYTEEMKKRQIDIDEEDKIQKYIQEDYMIPAKKATLTTSDGRVIEGYKLHAKPLLYQHSQIFSQVLSVPLNILNTKAYVNNTPTITVIRAHLIRQIDWRKRELKKAQGNRHYTPRRNNKLSLESIYELLDLKAPNKKKRDTIRNHVSSILDSFVENNYIENYNVYKEGRKIAGFEFHLQRRHLVQ